MKSLLFLITLTFATLSLNAQQTFIWDHYGLAIDVPDDFQVLKNTDTEFEMSGDGMEMYMYLFDADITLETMDEAIISAAAEIQMGEIDRALTLKGDGLDGLYVEGYKDGHRVMLAGFIDPASHTNFMMLVMFGDDDSVADEDAIAIFNTVRVN